MFKKLLIPFIASMLLVAFAVPVAAAVPDAPTALTLTPGVDSIDVSWTAPANDGGAAITGYIVDLTGDATAQQTPAGTSTTFASLAPGNYNISVVAVNADGNSPALTGSTTIDPPAPTAPSPATNVTVVVTGQSVTISWTAPTDDGGDPAIAYTVLSGAGGGQTENTSLTLNNVAPGTYTATVDASNTGGTSTSAASAPFTVLAPATPPSAPQSATASVSDQTVTVTWTAPLDDGGDPAIEYSVELTGQATQTGLTGLSTTFPGLAPGAYTATVIASNGAGVGGSVGSNTVSVAAPATVPGTPQSISAAVSDDDATITWSAPASNGGSPITGYSVSVDGAAPQIVAGTSIALTSLTPGSHTVTVAAVNAVGTGASGSTSFVIAAPATVPGVPQNLSATPSGTSASITWAAPASDGGAAITGYSLVVDGVAQPEAGLSATLNGLTPGSHSVTVAAINSVGTGTATAVVNFIIEEPITAPSAPQNPTASVTDQTITVSWTASADDGGDPAVTYEVTVPGLTPQSTTGTSVQFVDVPAGDYVASVRASTPTGGQSAAVSAASVTVEAPATAPGQPTELTATVSGLNVLVSWEAPAANGAPILSYAVTLNGTPSTEAGSPINFDDLAPGNYTVTVAATNSAGTGVPASETFTIEVPVTPPTTPANVNASVSGQQVTVSWTASNDGGDPAGVEYNVSLNGATPRVVTGTSTQFDGVAAGSYTVTVTATNSEGTSAAGSDTFSVVSAPSAPRSLAAAADGSTILATWDAPASNGNQALTSYEIGLERNGSRLETTSAGAGVTSIGFENQSPGTYTIKIRAINATGPGPYAEIDVEVGSTAPSAPTNVTGSADFQTVTVTWDPPLSAGNSPLLGYEVTVGTVTQSVDAGTRSVVLADVEPGTYVALVTANNSGGSGLAGESASFKAETVFSPFESSADLIGQQYADFLGRQPDQAGLDYWTGVLGADRNQGPVVIENFMRSAEFAPRRSVARLYLAFFDRAPDRAGFDFWANSLRQGGQLNDIAAAFADSTEFRNTYGELNDAEFIALVYNNVLLRQPDLEGFRFWLNRMQDPNVSRGDLMVAFSESAEFKRNSGPAVDVIMTYRGMLDRAPDSAGFSFWVSAVAGRNDALQTLIFNFLVSEEYSNRVR